jgi:D-serine deaminase-like pyridoxal phosphate-dependent protein
MTKANWYQLEDPSSVNSPGLIFYEDRIQDNINVLISMIDQKSRLRPHVKTHKSAEVTRMMLAAGLQKFKCATIAEAEMLGLCAAPDVLLAYQPVGPNLERFQALKEQFPNTRFSCLVDNKGTAESIAEVARQHDKTFKVYIDLNVGMNRTGIHPDEATNLYETLLDIKGLDVLGFHAYDGHIHDADFSIRQQKAREIITVLQTLSQTIEEKHQHKPIVIAGGTPTIPIFAKETDFECSPGTFALWDEGYQNAFAEQHFSAAALILARVVSLPNEKFICLDLGHKAVAAENPLANRITFLNAPNLVPVSQSEEHLVMDAGENHQHKIGDVLYGLPFHVCPSVALYDQLLSISSKRPPETWQIVSRQRKSTI